ncbi:MAG: hypothetical protein JXA33_08615 [Anaerolineae bacterium]|nr:hypothetical protein [Anaerolineae bacterium]
MITRRERLMATLRGDPVDRPAVSFYEIGGWRLDPDDDDPFNVYNGPGWRELIQLAEEETDLIRMLAPTSVPAQENCRDAFFHTEISQRIQRNSTEDNNASVNALRPLTHSRLEHTTLTIAGRTMTSLTRHDADVATVWTVEHLLKDTEDARAYLQLPDEAFVYEYNVDVLRAEETALGDAGIVMVDVGDPLCAVASLFSMADYTVLALTGSTLFHQLLEKHARVLYPMVEQVAREFPGHLWRIYGPEYASVPFLPPRLFEEYVVRYTGPMVDMIQKYGGFARIHCHGRLKHILPYIVAMHPAGLDPIEPPPQGDVMLSDVRREYGAEMVLFGNIEASEIETLSTSTFAARVRQALRDGTEGSGRGFVLMPSSCPYGREISSQVLRNYETMVKLAQEW